MQLGGTVCCVLVGNTSRCLTMELRQCILLAVVPDLWCVLLSYAAIRLLVQLSAVYMQLKS